MCEAKPGSSSHGREATATGTSQGEPGRVVQSLIKENSWFVLTGCTRMHVLDYSEYRR